MRTATAAVFLGSVLVAGAQAQSYRTSFETSLTDGNWPNPSGVIVNGNSPSCVIPATAPGASSIGVVLGAGWSTHQGSSSSALTYFQTQGLRATLSPSSSNQSFETTVLIESLSHLVFKLASASASDSGSSPKWTLKITVSDGDQEVVVGGIDSESPKYIPKGSVWSRHCIAIPNPGKYFFKFVIEGDGSSTGWVSIDELEIFTSSDPPPQTLVDLNVLEADLTNNFAPQYPLSASVRNERQWRIDALDHHALNYQDLYSPVDPLHPLNRLTGTGATQPSNFTAWFQSRASSAIAHIQTCVPAMHEACITKLYSSAYIVKTRHGAFGVDVTQGPNTDATAYHGEVEMRILDSDLESLADSIDFMMITHYHHDHAFLPMVEKMNLRSKPVYGPNAGNGLGTICILEHYLNEISDPLQLAATTGILDPGAMLAGDTIPLSVGPGQAWAMRVFEGQQWMESGTDCHPPIPTTRPPGFNSPKNYSYHITTPDGLRIMVVGDHRDALIQSNPALSGSCAVEDSILSLVPSSLGWWPRLADLIESNGSYGLGDVDVKLGAGPLIHSVWQDRMIGHFGPLVRIHGHEWEMTHDDLSRASAAWSSKTTERDSAFPLSFGEHLHLQTFTEVPTVTDVTANSATITFRTAMPIETARAEGLPPGVTQLFEKSTSSSPASIQLSGLLPSTGYHVWIECATRTPGLVSGSTTIIPIRDMGGYRYGSTAEPIDFSTNQ